MSPIGGPPCEPHGSTRRIRPIPPQRGNPPNRQRQSRPVSARGAAPHLRRSSLTRRHAVLHGPNAWPVTLHCLRGRYTKSWAAIGVWNRSRQRSRGKGEPWDINPLSIGLPESLTPSGPGGSLTSGVSRARGCRAGRTPFGRRRKFSRRGTTWGMTGPGRRCAPRQWYRPRARSRP